MNEFELRQKLRALPRERDPQRDLWLGIESRIRRRAQRQFLRFLPVALAAGLVTAAVLGVAWRNTLAPASHMALAPVTLPIEREASALELEYRAAIAQVSLDAMPGPLRRSARALDADALQLLSAIRVRPDSRFLLTQLRNTYAHRLRLTRWSLLG